MPRKRRWTPKKAEFSTGPRTASRLQRRFRLYEKSHDTSGIAPARANTSTGVTHFVCCSFFVAPSLLLLQGTEARLPAFKAQIDKEETLPRVNSSLFDEAQRISPRILAVERSLAPGADDDSASRRIVNVFRG